MRFMHISSSAAKQMALFLMFMFGVASAARDNAEMALANITRFATGDLFSLVGSDCGLTRCMEVSHGTALSAMGARDSCVCQCRKEFPAFREDQKICVNHIDECIMASFGRGSTKPQIPFVFLPLKGQIVYPSKEIIFTDVDDAICAVTSAQYLSPSGWVTLRDLLDNDVPFGLYRDEGSTFLQWRGSPSLHARLDGRLVAVHVLCSALSPARLVASCAAFRVAGASHNSLLDVRSIPFHAGEVITSETSIQTPGLSVLESLAIGVCVLMLVFVYAAGIIFYIHYKKRQKRKEKDPEMNITSSSENGSTLGSTLDLNNMMLKTNPLLKMDGLGSDYMHDAGLSDVSEHTEDTMDTTSTHNNEKFQKLEVSPILSNKFQKLNTNVISAIVHSRKKKPIRPSLRSSTPDRNVMHERLQRRSASPEIERAPHSELSIVDCSIEESKDMEREQSPPALGEPAIRRKLYFNPVFFETEHLKNPPPAAVEFLIKIREVMSIARDKITTKRYVPNLSDIPEEESYHSIDLGWDIPCARRGRRFSAISLKRENSRRTAHCGGCPGCDNRQPLEKSNLTRSNSCKTCVSDEYKQTIVRKWLDEVPSPTSRNVSHSKSIAKVSGTPRVVSPKPKEVDAPVCAPANVNNAPKITDVTLKEQDAPKPKDQKHKLINEVTNRPKQIVVDQVNTPILNLKKLMEHKDKKESSTISKRRPSKDDIQVIRELKVTDTCPIVTKNYQLVMPDIKKPIVISKLLMQEVKYSENTAKTETSSSPNRKVPSSHASRKIRKKLPPPPPPPTSGKPQSITSDSTFESTAPVAESETETECSKEEVPIPPEVKVKMEAVIQELNKCRRTDGNLSETKGDKKELVSPKIVIPVYAAPEHYFSDDNLLADSRRKQTFIQRETFKEFNNLGCDMLKKRRFSLACSPELINNKYLYNPDTKQARETLKRSWQDVRKKVETNHFVPPRQTFAMIDSHNSPVSEILINTNEPLYGNIAKPGSLTIQVRGSPIEARRDLTEEFDPDTLDRKPKHESNKRVEKILLKSGGSFKYKPVVKDCAMFDYKNDTNLSSKIGNLRQIYESKAKIHDENVLLPYYGRRSSVPYAGHEIAALVKSVKTSDIIRQLEAQKDNKPPIPPKLVRRASEVTPKFFSRNSPEEKRRIPDERERYAHYLKAENIIARRSGRRSNRTRSRRTDLRKLYRTEDSGYLSTDSNESKRRANYLMQLRPKSVQLEKASVPPPPTVIRTPILQHLESESDDMESICDGRSESGGESIETDSVFFGNFDDSKEMLEELGMSHYDVHNKMNMHEQIDSGFMGETNIILSGDSDSEHRSVISIVTGRDGRTSSASITHLDDTPYKRSVEC